MHWFPLANVPFLEVLLSYPYINKSGELGDTHAPSTAHSDLTAKTAEVSRPAMMSSRSRAACVFSSVGSLVVRLAERAQKFSRV